MPDPSSLSKRLSCQTTVHLLMSNDSCVCVCLEVVYSQNYKYPYPWERPIINTKL